MTDDDKLVEVLRKGVCAENMGCLPQACGCEYMAQAADRIEALTADRERLVERNRLMGDVIDFACGHIADASEAIAFLDAYRSDEQDSNPQFVAYRKAQALQSIEGARHHD